MGKANKTVVACSTTEEAPPEAWEQVLSEELAFDFSPRMTPPCGCPLANCESQGKVGVKEAIIRWLEEQL